MSNAPQNNNYHWTNGAFCENCGILTGNVTNNGIFPIYHEGCKPGCKSVWEDQDPISDDEEEEEEEEDKEEEDKEEEDKEEKGREGRGEVDWEVLDKESIDYIVKISRQLLGEVDWEVLDKEPKDYIVKWNECYHAYTE
jgi:hypothetical protein